MFTLISRVFSKKSTTMAFKHDGWRTQIIPQAREDEEEEDEREICNRS